MNYQNSATLIHELVKTPFASYDQCVKLLRGKLSNGFPALFVEGNPILSNIASWNRDELAFVIAEYSGFSNEAIHMLLDAQIRVHDWTSLRNELAHNIEEEMGLETKGIPHLEMMRQGYRSDLGVETDSLQYSDITKTFIRRMRDLFRRDNNAFIAGALVAFEGTAIAEFHIVDMIIRKYKELCGNSLKVGSLTQLYIDGHKDFEIGHEQGLIDSCEIHINQDNFQLFVMGYCQLAYTMNQWWDQLAMETWYRYLGATSLHYKDIETFDITAIFRK